MDISQICNKRFSLEYPIIHLQDRGTFDMKTKPSISSICKVLDDVDWQLILQLAVDPRLQKWKNLFPGSAASPEIRLLTES